jgi:predicted dehydrogenase
MTNTCLRAGLHVYCEKEMSNDIEKARSMVHTARETGKLLQIGHQRRSNPYYKHAYHLLHDRNVFGRITHVSGQWNQAKLIDLGWPVRYELDASLLNKYGYGSMAEFRNWRWFHPYAGGPMADLGSHQVDVFNWFLKAPPRSVYATGSNTRAIEQAKEESASFVPQYEDNVMSIYEWDTPTGVVRGFYQVLLTSTHRGFYESFMGTDGSFDISEISDRSAMFREAKAPKQDWEEQAEKVEREGVEAMTFQPSRSGEASKQIDEKLAADLTKPPHMVHLENFFNTIRGSETLHCDAEVGFETAVTVLRINDALRNGGRYEYTASEFKA